MAGNTNKFVVDVSFLLCVLLPDEKSTEIASQGKKLFANKNNIFLPQSFWSLRF